MNIRGLETFLLDIPLRRPHRMSFGSPACVNAVVVRVIAGEWEGWGEAVTLGGPSWSEESAETIEAVIDTYLRQVVIGMPVESPIAIARAMDARVRGNRFAKAAVEMAVFDCLGKKLGLPVYTLLGGKVRDSVPLSWSIAGPTPDREIEEAGSRKEEGIRIFKLKVGSLPLQDDLARVRSAREVLGAEVRLRVDANQGWNMADALKAAAGLGPYDVDFIEQPLPEWDLDGLERVNSFSRIPVLLDESLRSVADAVNAVRRRAAGAFGIKLAKHGGFINARAVAAVAEGAGIPCYVGCMVESGLGTAAYLHFAVSCPQVTLGCELFGPLLLNGDIVDRPTLYRGGEIAIQDGPGLGVSVDMGLLGEYRRR